MADTDTNTQAARQKLISLARSQVGSHYVWGGAGNTPGNSDGAWYRPAAVHLHDNDPNPPQHGHPDNGRTQPIMLAAYCRVDGYKVCAGRSALPEIQALPHGDSTNDGQLNSCGWTWPRPDGLIDSHSVVWGEPCVDVAHYDCIGFINWCISQLFQPFQHSIKQVIAMTKDVGFSDVWAGDILTIGDHHIGFAAGPQTAVHAKGTQYGVVETNLPGAGWGRVGRMPSNFWHA